MIQGRGAVDERCIYSAVDGPGITRAVVALESQGVKLVEEQSDDEIRLTRVNHGVAVQPRPGDDVAELDGCSSAAADKAPREWVIGTKSPLHPHGGWWFLPGAGNHAAVVHIVAAESAGDLPLEHESPILQPFRTGGYAQVSKFWNPPSGSSGRTSPRTGRARRRPTRDRRCRARLTHRAVAFSWSWCLRALGSKDSPAVQDIGRESISVHRRRWQCPGRSRSPRGSGVSPCSCVRGFGNVPIHKSFTLSTVAAKSSTLSCGSLSTLPHKPVLTGSLSERHAEFEPAVIGFRALRSNSNWEQSPVR